jgi:hypothetical protein
MRIIVQRGAAKKAIIIQRISCLKTRSSSTSPIIQPNTSSYFTISTMVILSPCNHPGLALWGLITRQRIFF